MQENHDFSTSDWPLPSAGLRFLTPHFLVELLRQHPLSEDCYPLAFGFYPQASGHQMRRQKHANHLLIYCVRGKGELWIDKTNWNIKAGDLIILPEGVAHAYHADAKEPWSIYWIHYEGRQAKAYTDFVAQSQAVLTVGQHPSLITELEAILSLHKTAYALPAFIHGACLLKALLTSLSARITRAALKEDSLDIEAIQRLMQHRLGSALDLDDLAQQANLSKYYFIRRFHALTGHTPIQHFIHLKMQHACQLLDNTTDPIKQIATSVGYDDPYYFSKIFKKVVGVSPKNYRRSRAA
jgi:AraC-like DNA-binding protein